LPPTPCKLTAASFEFRRNSNTGIKFSFSGEKPNYLQIQHGGTIDILGDFWNKLPAGLGPIGQMLAPLKCRLRREDFPQNSRTFTATVYLGYNQLGRERVRSVLQHIVRKGDPVVALEIMYTTNPRTGEGKPLVHIPTKASLVLAALEASVDAAAAADNSNDDAANAQSIIYDGPLPEFKRGGQLKRVIGALRWWFFPLAVALACWMLLIQPEKVLQYTPRWHPGDEAPRTIISVLPPHPETLSGAYSLGQLAERWQTTCAAPGSKPAAAAVCEGVLAAAAAAAVGRERPLTGEELLGVHDRILEIEGHRGVVARVRGFFTFVNAMWLLAIFGLLISVGPALYHLLEPLRRLLARYIELALRKIIIPLIEFCHNWGAIEGAIYAVAWMFIAEGYRSPEDYGMFISLTGLLGLVLAFLYSTALHAHKVSRSKDQEAFLQMLHGWLALCWVPLAVHHQSTLLGYGVVCALYTVLGFNITCYGLCYCIGFKRESALQRCVVVSALILALHAGARFATQALGDGLGPACLRPFGSAVSVMGSVVLFLGLLIYSSRYYSPGYRSEGHAYPARQVFMIVALLGALAAGSMLGLPGMFNTGVTFTVLYVMEKYIELHYEMKWNAWFLMLLISATMYKASLWLHRNPDFVKSLFEAAVVDE